MSPILSAIEVSAKGLSVQRTKMNVVAENLANVETTRTETGEPYRRKRVAVRETEETGSFGSALTRTMIFAWMIVA